MNLSGVPITTRSTNAINTDVSTSDTIKQMSRIVSDSINLPSIKETATSLILPLGTNPKYSDIANLVWQFVRQNLTFKTDEENSFDLLGLGDDKELLFTPHFILSNAGNATGDCDDYSTFAATMLKACGIKNVYFVTVACDKDTPGRWSHVYVAYAKCCGDMVSFDTSHGSYVGWEVDKHKVFRKAYWDSMTGDKVFESGIGEKDMLANAGMGTTFDPYWDNYPTGGSDSGGGGFDYGSLISTGLNDAFKLTSMVLSQPKPGQYIQTGPGGTLNYQLPVGSNSFLPSGVNLGLPSGGVSPYLIIGGIALIALVALKK